MFFVINGKCNNKLGMIDFFILRNKLYVKKIIDEEICIMFCIIKICIL